MWIEIFKTGRHTDSAGNTRDITKDDLDHIVASYDPAEHEAPVVIGHPKDNAPAYGWVETLKREGGVLLAKLKQVVPEFVDMVKRGLFKKRSVALYPDLTLKHVGFLGALPPAVKGLRDVDLGNFEQEGGIIMFSEFDENTSAGERLHRKILEFLESPRGEDMTYGDAFNVVCCEERDLAEEYAEELLGSAKPPPSGETAGDRLTEKVREFLQSPRGREISYRDAFETVCREERDLASKYAQELGIVSVTEPDISEGAGVRLTEKVREFLQSPRGKDVSYRDALDIVCQENRDLAEEYAEELISKRHS